MSHFLSFKTTPLLKIKWATGGSYEEVLSSYFQEEEAVSEHEEFVS